MISTSIKNDFANEATYNVTVVPTCLSRHSFKILIHDYPRHYEITSTTAYIVAVERKSNVFLRIVYFHCLPYKYLRRKKLLTLNDDHATLLEDTGHNFSVLRSDPNVLNASRHVSVFHHYLQLVI